jgi:hypothetical protein
MLKIIMAGGGIGFLIPTLYLLIFYVFGVNPAAVNQLLFWLWPSSIFLMATDGQEHTWFAVEVIAISVGVNILLYTLGSFLLVLIWRLLKRKS